MATQRVLEILLKISNGYSNELQALKQQLQGLGQVPIGGEGLKQTSNEVEGVTQKTGLLGKGLGAVAFAFNEVTQAAQRLAQAGGQAFDLLIGQNVRLREQTLGLSALLANVQQVSIGGENVADPVKAIQTVLPEVQRQIDQIRIDSLKLSSITSSELVESFKLVAQQANALGINLEQAEKVTIKLNASATTLGLPLGQAQTYIAQISNLNIDPTFNTLAKTLELNNEKARSLIAQGRLYEYIDQRTKALVAGQDLAAKGFAGVVSNVQEFFEVLTQKAGEPILDAILKPLNELFARLQEVQPQVNEFFTSVANFVVGIAEKLQTAGGIIAKALQPLGEALLSIAGSGGEAVGQLLNSIAEAAIALATALAPLLQIVGEVAKVFADFVNSDIGRLATQMGLLLAVAVPLAPVLIGVGAGAIAAATGVGALTVAAALAAAPFVVLGAALIPVIAGLEALKLATTNDAIEELSKSTNNLADESLNYAAKLKALQEVEKNGGKLSEEQVKQRKELLALSAGTKQSIEQQISDLKALQPANQEQANALKVQIALLEQRAKLLSSQEGVGLGNRALQDLGKTKDLIDQSLKGAQTDLLNPAKAEDAAKRVQEFTQIALENGRITRAEAAKNLEALQNNQGLELKTRLTAQKALTELVKQGDAEEIDSVKTKEKTIEAEVKAGRLSQIEGDRQLTAAKTEELDKQLENTQTAIKRELEITGGRSSPRLVALRREETELQGQRTAIVEDGNRKRAQAELTAADNEAKILEGKRSRGLVSEEAFANQSLEITKRRIDLEQKELERQRSLLKPGDTAGRQAIDAKEAELNTKREQAEEQFQARKVAILERAQRKATDAVKLAEVERNTATDQLLARREIRQVEADLRGVESKRKTIAAEIELERQRFAELEKQPKLSDPVKEAERQEKIRASRIKTAELTDSLVKNEIEQQQAVFRVISERLDRQAQAAKNIADEQVQPLNTQLQLQDALTKSLDNQNKLLQARSGLQQSLNGYVEGQLGILSKLAKTDEDRKTIGLLAEAAKFKALQTQQAIEQQSLEIQLKQNAAALEREKIQNRIAQIQNQADQAQAVADLAKVKAKPDATPEEIRAAELNVQAKQASGIGLQIQGELLNQQGQINDQLGNLQRQSLAVKQQNERDQQQAKVIDQLPDQFKTIAQNELTKNILGQLGLGNSIGGINTDSIKQAFSNANGVVGNFNLPGQFNPTANAGALPAPSPRLNELFDQLEAVTGGKGAGNKANQASDLEKTLKQQQAAETVERKLQGRETLTKQEKQAEAARKGVINALEQKRTQLVQLQGEQGEALLAIEESLADGGGRGGVSNAVLGDKAGLPKDLIAQILDQFKNGAVPKGADLDNLLDAFRKSTDRKIVATLPANPFKGAEEALKQSISKDVEEGRGKSDETKAKREALDKLEKARTQLVLLQGDQGKAILGLAFSASQTAGAADFTARKTGEVAQNTQDTANKLEGFKDRSANQSAGQLAPAPQVEGLKEQVTAPKQGGGGQLGVSGSRIAAELEKNAAFYMEIGGDVSKRAAEKLAVQDSIANRIALEKAGKLKPREGAALSVDLFGDTLDTVKLRPTQTPIAPIQQANNTGNAAILAELKRISGAALRPIEAPITQQITNPDPSIAAQMANRQITATLTKAFAGVK